MKVWVMLLATDVGFPPTGLEGMDKEQHSGQQIVGSWQLAVGRRDERQEAEMR